MQKMCNILFLTQYNQKMNEINEHIKKFNSLSYNEQCKHGKTKLLSFKSKDIPYTLFFKRLYILLDSFPMFLKDATIETGIRKVLFVNLWARFDKENKYFYEDIGLIKIECIKLLSFKYLVAIPVKNTDNYIYILFTDKYDNDSRKKRYRYA